MSRGAKRSVYFVTGNMGKLEEVRDILGRFGITVKHIKDEKPELQDSVDNIVTYAARCLADKHKKPVVVEDVGLYFKAYKDFPGVFSKQMYNSIGFEGMMRLLRGRSRSAYFKGVVGFCEPGKKPVLFTGILEGRIAKRPVKGGHSHLPYDQIFIAKGYSRPLSTMMDIKNSLSHRRQAFEKLARWLAC